MSTLGEEIIEGRRKIRRANFYLKLDDTQKAKSFYEDALNLLPENIDVLMILSQIEDDLEKAIRYLRDAHSINPDHKQVKYLLADSLMANNQYEEAYDLLNKLNLPNDDKKLMFAQIHSGADIDTKKSDFIPSRIDSDLRYVLALYHHKRDNHSLATQYLRNQSTYQAKHLSGLQYLYLNDYSLARSRLQGAIEQFKENHLSDGPIYSKLLLDSFLAIENPSERIATIRDNIHHFTTEDHWRAYEAMFVAWFNSGETEFSEREAKEWLHKAKEYAKDDDILLEKFDSWEELLND